MGNMEELFRARIDEYNRIIQDLEFLKTNLKEYR